MHSCRDIPIVVRFTATAALALGGACEFSGTTVDESVIARVVITDQEGRDWDVTQAVVRYGFDADRFLFGLGASKFTPFQHPDMAAPGDSGYPEAGDGSDVVGLAGAEARAYRIDDLLDVEVVDDAIDGAPVAVVIRPLLADRSPSVHSRILGADTLTISASGWVYAAQSVLYDLETRSLWYRLDGDDRLTCIAGVHFTKRLAPLRFAVAPWSAWRALRPDSRFMLRPPPGPPIGGGGG